MKSKILIILLVIAVILVAALIKDNQQEKINNDDNGDIVTETETETDKQEDYNSDDREIAYSGENAELVQVSNPTVGKTVSGGVINIKGMAPGFWYFEAVAPVVVVNWNGLIIGEGYITAEGEWMTSELVPFSGDVEYTFDSNTPYNRGWLILKRDNPSGLPENDASLEIPIFFEK